MKRLFASTVAGLAMLVGPATAEKFPEREITFIVPFAAGGSVDVSTRALMLEVEKIIGVPVQVVNRPGGQGTVGPQALASSKPDGYTIGAIGAGSVAITPLLLKTPYTIDDFAYIGGYGRFRYGIAVETKSPIKTLDDLIAEAKKRRVTFGAGGAPNNLGMFKLGRLTGTRFQFIPFPSGAEAVTAAMGGHVDSTVQSATEIMPNVEAGRLRLLAVADPERWPTAPDVKTLREHGYDIIVAGIVGLAAPKGVPEIRLHTLTDAIKKAIALPVIAERLAKLDMVPAPMTRDEFVSFLREAHAEAGPALREAGLIKN
jgi:tripartite-type tricarboxylate transporter receptor subunit TctC